MKRVLLVLVLLAGVGVAIWALLPNTEPNGGRARPTPVPSVRPSPSPAPSGVASLLPDERLAAAVKAAFPSGNAATDKDGVRYVFETHRLVDAPFGAVLVSEGKAPDAAHVSGGRLDIAYLRSDGDSYAVARRFPAAVTIGSFGQMSDWTVSDKFADMPVIDAEGGFTGQGYSCAAAVLAELAPQGPRTLGQVQTLYDDSGAAVDRPAVTIEGKFADIVRNRGFDIRYTGTKIFTDHYALRGGKFVRDGASQLPEC